MNTRRSNFARASTARWEGSSECTHRWDRTTAKFALSQHVARRDKCEPGRDGLVKRVASQSPFAAVVLTEPLHDLLWKRRRRAKKRGACTDVQRCFGTTCASVIFLLAAALTTYLSFPPFRCLAAVDGH